MAAKWLYSTTSSTTSWTISNDYQSYKLVMQVWSGSTERCPELQNSVIGSVQDFDRSDQRFNSLNLQHANYMFFFEQPDSPINRQQGEKRIWRPGQVKPVYYIDPFMDGSVDERIFYSNQQGKKLLDQLLKGEQVLDGLGKIFGRAQRSLRDQRPQHQAR
jgi:hypothetical protein